MGSDLKMARSEIPSRTEVLKPECRDHEVVASACLQTYLLRACGGLNKEFRLQRILRCRCRLTWFSRRSDRLHVPGKRD